MHDYAPRAALRRQARSGALNRGQKAIAALKAAKEDEAKRDGSRKKLQAAVESREDKDNSKNKQAAKGAAKGSAATNTTKGMSTRHGSRKPQLPGKFLSKKRR